MRDQSPSRIWDGTFHAATVVLTPSACWCVVRRMAGLGPRLKSVLIGRWSCWSWAGA